MTLMVRVISSSVLWHAFCVRVARDFVNDGGFRDFVGFRISRG